MNNARNYTRFTFKNWKKRQRQSQKWESILQYALWKSIAFTGDRVKAGNPIPPPSQSLVGKEVGFGSGNIVEQALENVDFSSDVLIPPA